MLRFLFIFIFFLLTARMWASELHIIVDKSDRILSVYEKTMKLHSFRIGLGGSPAGDKEKEGDSKTPEGIFYICVKNPKSSYYLSLGISYPDEKAGIKGLRSGLITQAEHDNIVSAQKRKIAPPWKTKLGGEVFIHGRGSSSDWTRGCIALDDKDMKLLFDLIEIGTQIEICP